MRSRWNRRGIALAALCGGLSALAGLCLDRGRPLRGCLLGLGLGASAGTVMAGFLAGKNGPEGLYAAGTRYYEDYHTESGF